MGSELCLVGELPKTASEILAENAASIATTKLVARRFPDAVFRNGQWESPSVGISNAQGISARMHPPVSDTRAVNLELYVLVKPKGCEPARVYSSNDYHLAPGHVEGLLQTLSAKLVIKSLLHILRCQEAI